MHCFVRFQARRNLYGAAANARPHIRRQRGGTPVPAGTRCVSRGHCNPVVLQRGGGGTAPRESPALLREHPFSLANAGRKLQRWRRAPARRHRETLGEALCRRSSTVELRSWGGAAGLIYLSHILRPLFHYFSVVPPKKVRVKTTQKPQNRRQAGA